MFQNGEMIVVPYLFFSYSARFPFLGERNKWLYALDWAEGEEQTP